MLGILILLAAFQPAAAKPVMVRGKVTSADTGEPLRRAQIVARPRRQEQDFLSAITNSSGVYQILLPPGRYGVTASKNGYVARGYQARATSENSAVLVVAANTPQDNVDFSLVLGAVVSGRITDEDGSPLPGLKLKAMRRYYDMQGKPHLNLTNIASSDDHGEYRLYDLAPGRYYVKADSELGNTPFGSVFYPGSANLSDAKPVSVPLGQEVQGINMTFPDTKAHTINGRVVDSRDDAPIRNPWVTLWPDDYSGTMIANARGKADGTFRLNNVTPGHYRINVSSQNGNLGKMIDVGSGDLNLTLGIGAGATVKGQVRAVGKDLPATLRLMLYTMDGRMDAESYRGQTQTKADGTFEIPGVQPCVCRVVPIQATQGATFFLGSVMIGEKEVIDSGFTVPETGAIQMTVTVDFGGAHVAGKTFDVNGEPLPRTLVLLVSADPKKRTDPRFLGGEISNPDSTFRFAGVVPGEYLMLGLPDEDPGPLFDPDVFPKFEKFMQHVTVERDANVTMDFKFTKELLQLFKQYVP